MPALAFAPSPDLSDVPLHCEAYPSFAMNSAVTHWRDGVVHCEWEDRLGGLVGQMELKLFRGPEFEATYSMGTSTYRHSARLRLRIALCRMISRRMETRAFCPICDQVKDRLYFRWHRWGCQHCQKLVQRRSLMTELDKLIVRREELIRLVHGPRKDTQSSLATFRPRYELNRLNGLFADYGLKPHLDYPLAYVAALQWVEKVLDLRRAEAADDAPAYLDAHRPA